MRISCTGTHTEQRTRVVTREENGHTVRHTETYTVTVVDFYFLIDVSQYLLQEELGAPIWIVGDRDPAYRGEVKLQVDNTPLPPDASPKDLEKQRSDVAIPRRRTTEGEETAYAARKDRRRGAGLPPWALLPGEERGTEAALDSEGERRAFLGTAYSQFPGFDDVDLRPPSHSLRDWANQYIKSVKLLKDFKFRKEVYGWNYEHLHNAIMNTLRVNCQARTQVRVEMTVTARKIHVQPYNIMSRMLSTTWVLVLLWIFLIYPLIIWPFKRFSSHGGGQWRIAGSAFAFTKWVHLPDSLPGEAPADYVSRHGGDINALRATPHGVQRIVGLRDGDFFALWQETIARLVRQSRTDQTPLTEPLVGMGLLTGNGLDNHLLPIKH